MACASRVKCAPTSAACRAVWVRQRAVNGMLALLASRRLDHFRTKWIQVRRQKMRQSIMLERRSDAIRSQSTLVPWVASVSALIAATAASAADAPRVVVTTKPIHSLIANIMEGVGTPILIVDGSASPHTFTLKPSSAKAINEADIFVRVSEAVEPFSRKIVAALPAKVTLITLSESKGVQLFDQREGGTFEEHLHDDARAAHSETDHKQGGSEKNAGKTEHDHEHEAKDGHIWLDPVNAKAIVETVTAALAQRYPAAADTFRANAARLNVKLDQLTADIMTNLEPVKSRPFIIFHDATQYFEKRFGLQAAGSITISPDVQPSAKRLTAVRKKIAQLGAVCVFTEPSFQPKLVAAVIEGSTSRTGEIDAEGIGLSAGNELYFELMRRISRNLQTCLSGDR